MFLSIGLIHSDLISEKGIVGIPGWSHLLRQTFPNCGGVLVAKMANSKHCEVENDAVSSDDDGVEINCDFGISHLPSRTKVVAHIKSPNSLKPFVGNLTPLFWPLDHLRL